MKRSKSPQPQEEAGSEDKEQVQVHSLSPDKRKPHQESHLVTSSCKNMRSPHPNNHGDDCVVTSIDCGTTGTDDAAATSNGNKDLDQAATGSIRTQFSPRSNGDGKIEKEATPVEASESTSGRPELRMQTGSSVSDLIRAKEASMNAIPDERQASTATLSPSFAALSRGKRADKSQPSPNLAPKEDESTSFASHSVVPGSTMSGDDAELRTGGVKDIRRRLEQIKQSSVNKSPRATCQEPLSPSLAAARSRKCAAFSVWGGDTSSPSASSVDGLSSSGSEASAKQPSKTDDESDQAKLELEWPSHSQEDPDTVSGGVCHSSSDATWHRNGGLVNKKKPNFSAKIATWRSTSDGVKAMGAVRPGPLVPTRPKNPGPKGGPFDEEEILRWIRKVTKLDIDPECGVHYSLKDGMALCRLMGILQPDATIPEPSESSQAYKQMANICIFLQSCRSLGLPESVLFDAADLHYEKNIPKVVVALVALGELVPEKFPAFMGPQLELSTFSWTPGPPVVKYPQKRPVSIRMRDTREKHTTCKGTGRMNEAGRAAGDLTDEMISKIFDAVESTLSNGGLGPRQFSKFWRELSGGEQNLFQETKMFNRFNSSGEGVINLEEFVAGFRMLEWENAPEHEGILFNLRALAASRAVK